MTKKGSWQEFTVPCLVSSVPMLLIAVAVIAWLPAKPQQHAPVVDSEHASPADVVQQHFTMREGLRMLASNHDVMWLTAVFSLNSFCNGSILVLMVLQMSLPRFENGYGLTPSGAGGYLFLFGAVAFVFQVLSQSLPPYLALAVYLTVAVASPLFADHVIQPCHRALRSHVLLPLVGLRHLRRRLPAVSVGWPAARRVVRCATHVQLIRGYPRRVPRRARAVALPHRSGVHARHPRHPGGALQRHRQSHHGAGAGRRTERVVAAAVRCIAVCESVRVAAPSSLSVYEVISSRKVDVVLLSLPLVSPSPSPHRDSVTLLFLVAALLAPSLSASCSQRLLTGILPAGLLCCLRERISCA